jgi:hypothetical protein
VTLRGRSRALMSVRSHALKVHQLLKSFLQTETAEQWIKPLARKQSRRANMIALKNHYSGEGNTSRHIATAERIRDTFIIRTAEPYNSPCSWISSRRCLICSKKKTRKFRSRRWFCMLLKKVEHPQVQDAVNALRVRASMQGITFTECANHLSALVSELPDHQTPRKVSGAGSNRPYSRVTRNAFAVVVRDRLANAMASTCQMVQSGPGFTRIGSNSPKRTNRQ